MNREARIILNEPCDRWMAAGENVRNLGGSSAGARRSKRCYNSHVKSTITNLVEGGYLKKVSP